MRANGCFKWMPKLSKFNRTLSWTKGVCGRPLAPERGRFGRQDWQCLSQNRTELYRVYFRPLQQGIIVIQNRRDPHGAVQNRADGRTEGAVLPFKGGAQRDHFPPAQWGLGGGNGRLPSVWIWLQTENCPNSAK